METVKNYCQKHFKKAFFLVIIPVIGVFFANLFSSQVLATSETVNLQGRIVRNDTGNEGLNVSAGSPSCVFLGPSNDTCDFRVKYYTADTSGTLLATEVFNNREIGEYNGVFNLALGTGSFTAGSESTFRGIFLNNTTVYVEMDFAPDGTSYTETFLNPDGKRMAVRAAPYAISAGGASKQFQFDVENDATGYSNIAAGQVFYDGNDNVLRLYDGTNWLAVQASIGNLPSYWLLNEAADPDIIYSYTGLDVAFGGTDSSSPFFYDVSGQLLTLTNTGSGLSFRVNDEAGDTTPFAIDANGNVGIGTDAPSAKLEVTGGRTILESLGESQTLGIGRTDGAGLYWLGVNASSTPALSFLNNAGTERFRINDDGGLVQVGANDTALGLSLQKASVDDTHIEWRLFNASNNKDMTISGYNGTSAYTFVNFDWDNQVTNFETGTVGIGVASPNAFLGIKSATTSSAQINFVSSAGVNPSVPINGDLWWNGTNLYFFDGSSSVDLLAGGGGGGGSLFTDGGAITYLTSVTDNFALGGSTSSSPFYFDATAQLLTLTNTTSGLSFRVNDEAGDTTPFVIDADGNVGIGTVTPGGRLEIAGVSSVISNTAGDITFDSASGLISFAGDSITNVMNGTFSGNVILNGGQLQLGNHASNPTSVGEGSVVYNSVEKKLYYYKDTGWSEVGKVYSGTTGQTLRHNGTDWVANSALINDGTNITASGQVRVGNYSSKPSGIGEGSLVYDTTIGSLFVYDGTDWKAISTSETFSSTGIVSSGDYLQLTHNLNSNDILMNAWVKEGSTWKPATNLSNTIYNSQSNEWNKGDSAGKLRTTVRDTNIELSESINIGTGNDGSITVSSSTSINTTNIIAGRSCADGGDAVNYSVTALTATTATLESSPSVGCLNVGDEVLIINLRGTNTAFGNVGNYETLRIQSVASSTVTFTTSKTKFYGNNVGGDTNIGLGTGNQTVMLQRVPNYLNVTVNAAVNFLPDTWLPPTGAVNNGAGEGGVMFFRASGAVAINGNIHANALGYKGGNSNTGNNNYNAAGSGGEAFCGAGGLGTTSSGGTGGSGAAGGGGNTAGGTGFCGGGGGSSTTAGLGSASQGGSGGGGNGHAGGGGGGYGSIAGRGIGGSSQDGGTNTSGNGGLNAGNSGGGGGGGTFGTSDLSKIFFGTGGGGGGAYTSGQSGGVGGNGGGIVYISGNTVTVSGTLTSNGAVGASATVGAGYFLGGGGGASGGSIYLAGNTVVLGTSKTLANGGAGGVGVSNGTAGTWNGGAGGVGRIAVYYSSSISGTSTPASSNAVLPYYPYGVYTSDAIPTPNSVDYGDVKWSNSKNTFGNVSVQTRTSGNTHLSFDGLDDAVTIASTHGLTNINATIEAWVNIPSNMEQGAFVHIGGGASGYGFGVGGSTYDNRGNNLIILFSGVRWIDTNVDIGTGWHHIAMVISAAGVPTAYIDGVSLGAFSGTNSVNPSGTTDVGRTGSRYVKGIVGDVRVWNTARTLSNIQVNMNTELAGSEPNLVGYWKLTDGVGTTVDDLTSNNNDGTIVNGAKWVKTGSWLWEGWKPSTVTTNYLDVENADTHTNWVGSNATVAEGDVRRVVRTFEDEDETTVTNLTKVTSSTNGGYAETTISALDLSDYDYLTFWVRSSQVGNVLRIGMGESVATQHTDDITIDTTAVWQKVYWDLSDIQGTSRDAITKVRLTNLIASSNTIYIDNVRAEKVANSASGSTVQSTPNHVIQYRVIFSTTNTSYRPLLENIQITWSTGYRIEATSENISRIYNYTSGDKELKLTVSASAGSSYSSSWTETGGNVYRASGFVGIGDSTPDVELKVVGALCVRADADDCAGATAGTIYANNTSVQSADLAEMYKVTDLSIEAGDLVSLSPDYVGEVKKADLDNVDSLMGVISTAPGLLMNDNNEEDSRPVGLIGRLPVKVMTTGRSIEKGSPITSSVISGIGSIKEDSGLIVARSLEETFAWSDVSCQEVNSLENIKWPEDKGQNESKPCFKVPVDSFTADIRNKLMSMYSLTLSDSIYIGKVMAFVDVVWHQPQWLADDLSAMASDYSNGLLGGSGGGWRIEDDLIKTDKEVSVNNLYGTTATFNILSAGLLNIGNGGIVGDSGGNLFIAGDLLISGRLKSPNGSLVLEIGSGIGDLFAINNSDGDVVFSVDGTGKVGGKGVYRSEWVKVEANSSTMVYHNLGETPSSISIIKADNSQGYSFTSKGLGSDYYFEHNDNNTVKVYNKTNQTIYVKLTVQK